MAKVKSKYVCQNCGYESIGYLGKCPECSSWGTFVEEVQVVTPQSKGNQLQNSILNNSKPVLINQIEIDNEIRTKIGIDEFDRVLGGGIVQGSMILLAGDPGIGKSTLILQTCGKLCSLGKKILYASAEESATQIKLRAQRLNVDSEQLYIYSQTNLEMIKEQTTELKPDFLIIDSIQALYSNYIQSSAGSVSQIRECCNFLMQLAKQENIAVIIIGHVTKDGYIAGPKVLEHMVDTVIQFEGDKYKTYRILRTIKNRFGTTSEVGIFNMESSGLIEVKNPNEMFMHATAENATPGSVIIATNEGTRPLMLELQALVGVTPYPSPRRVTNGIDASRLLQVLAVLEKRVGLNLSKQDVYANIIGGIEVSEPAADLGLAVAIATCLNDVVITPKTVIIGEVGLSGEIRPVSNLEKRINEAEKLGFNKAIIPATNNLKEKFKSIKIVAVEKIIDAINAAIND